MIIENIEEIATDLEMPLSICERAIRKVDVRALSLNNLNNQSRTISESEIKVHYHLPRMQYTRNEIRMVERLFLICNSSGAYFRFRDWLLNETRDNVLLRYDNVRNRAAIIRSIFQWYIRNRMEKIKKKERLPDLLKENQDDNLIGKMMKKLESKKKNIMREEIEKMKTLMIHDYDALSEEKKKNIEELKSLGGANEFTRFETKYGLMSNDQKGTSTYREQNSNIPWLYMAKDFYYIRNSINDDIYFRIIKIVSDSAKIYAYDPIYRESEEKMGDKKNKSTIKVENLNHSSGTLHEMVDDLFTEINDYYSSMHLSTYSNIYNEGRANSDSGRYRRYSNISENKNNRENDGSSEHQGEKILMEYTDFMIDYSRGIIVIHPDIAEQFRTFKISCNFDMLTKFSNTHITSSSIKANCFEVLNLELSAIFAK